MGSGMGDPELGYEVFGQYTSITLRQGDGYPGIAYFAQMSNGTEITTQVKFAQANTSEPHGPSDWTIYVADSAQVSAGGTPDPLAIPEGLGLFVNSSRLSDGRPAIVYYDRKNGDL